MTAVITLVLITSAGIFGYLSNAYQGATIGFEKQSTKLLALEERLEQLEEDKVFLILFESNSHPFNSLSLDLILESGRRLTPKIPQVYLIYSFPF